MESSTTELWKKVVNCFRLGWQIEQVVFNSELGVLRHLLCHHSAHLQVWAEPMCAWQWLHQVEHHPPMHKQMRNQMRSISSPRHPTSSACCFVEVAAGIAHSANMPFQCTQLLDAISLNTTSMSNHSSSVALTCPRQQHNNQLQHCPKG